MTPDGDKTKTELLQELETLSHRISELEQARKKAEQELKQYQFIVESAHDAIFFKDTESRYIVVNNKVLEAFALPREKVIGKNDYQIMPNKDEAGKNIEDDNIVFKTGKPTEITKRMTDAEGKQRWFHGIKVPQFNDKGKISGLVGIARDITGRTQTEQELQVKTAILQNIICNIPYYVFWKDKNSVYLGCNDTFAKLAGLEKPEDIVGKTDYDLPWKKEESDFYRKIDKEVVSNAAPILNIEEPVHHGKGEVATILTSKVPLRNANGEITGILGIFTDITEHKKAEQALRESQKWQRSILDSIPDIAWLKDKDSRYIAVNEALCKAFGIKIEDILGKTDFDISPEDLAKRYRADDQEVMKSGKRKLTEEHWGKKKGKRIWIETIKTPIFNNEGQVIGTSGIARDITERKKAEEALRESGEKYRKLFEETTDAIFVADTETGIMIDCNRAATELVGREKSELIGKHQRILHPPEEIEGEFSRTFKQHLAEKEGQVLEAQAITKKGEIKDVEIRASRFVLKDKERIQALFRDITERKKAEQQLRQAQAQYRALVEQIPAITYTANLDEASTTTYVSPQIEKILGFSQADYKADPDIWRKQLHPEDRRRVLAEVKRSHERGESFDCEYRMLTKDGRTVWLQDHAKIVKDDEGNPLSLHGVMLDITEDKKREKQLDDYRKRIAQSEQLATLGSLGAALAHQLTQPLSVINLLIENVLTEMETAHERAPVANKLKDVLTEVSRITSIAQKFRDTARRASERTIKEVDLKAIAERILRLFYKSARQAKITLHLKDFDELPAIYSNEEDLEQLFFALVDNAIQAACPTDQPPGRRADGEKTRQLVISGARKDKHIELRFADNCSGIAAEHLDRIFEPFFTTKPTGEAMGLGLCIVEHIISRAGGKVSVESKLGKGTTFYVTLPINIKAK